MKKGNINKNTPKKHNDSFDSFQRRAASSSISLSGDNKVDVDSEQRSYQDDADERLIAKSQLKLKSKQS